jgi:hypothetical protein
MQSLGWEHYEVHEPEPHMLLFKYVGLVNNHLSELLLIKYKEATQLRTAQSIACSCRRFALVFGHDRLL